jgi:aspartate/glutamate racemase
MLSMKKTTGGKNIYGYPVGILMLETQFPRIPGDIGNATTWDFPVLYKIVKKATPDLVVRKGAPGLLEPYVQAAQELEKEGVRAITTNCGFLALFQKEMASAVNIPVFTSSLMQVPLAYTMIKPSQKVGIITVHSKSLSQKHLSCVGADKIPHIIYGTEGEEEFSRVILDDEMELDVNKSRDELVRVSKRMVSEHPEVGAIVLECTNMPPYAAAIQKDINLPIFDIYTLVIMVYRAVVKKDFSGHM